MSLARSIFTLHQSEQDAAIKLLARKAIDQARSRGDRPRDLFDRWTRALIHAKYAAGASKDELRELRRRCRALLHEELSGNPVSWLVAGQQEERAALGIAAAADAA